MNCKHYDEENCACNLFSGTPTYYELYEHWLKTKDKPKKKAQPEQLPGQLDVFDIIDKENSND